MAIRSGQCGQSHPGLQRQPPPARQQLKSQRLRAIRRPGHCGRRVRAVRRNSPSDVAACHRAVRRHTSCCSLVTRRSTRATQARAAPGANVGQPAPKAPSAIRSELLRGPQRARRVPGQNDGRSVASTVCRETPQNVTIWPFLLAISEIGWTYKKERHLESGVNQRGKDAQ
jgi:hypothetical protein